jgi:hypothetical protein
MYGTLCSPSLVPPVAGIASHRARRRAISNSHRQIPIKTITLPVNVTIHPTVSSQGTLEHDIWDRSGTLHKYGGLRQVPEVLDVRPITPSITSDADDPQRLTSFCRRGGSHRNRKRCYRNLDEETTSETTGDIQGLHQR